MLTTDTRIESWLAERRSIHAAATEGPWEADLDQHGETRGVWPTRPGEETIIGAYVAADGFDSVGYALGSDEDLTAIADAHNHLPAFIRGWEAVLKRHQRGQPYLLAVEWVCEGCSDNEDEREVPWPCETVRALEAVIGDE